MNWDAIYIWGVIKKGYPKTNYPHNLHIAIIPEDNTEDKYVFENCELHVKNGRFEIIISMEELDAKYQNYPEEYTTCRMFRWAVTHYKKNEGYFQHCRGRLKS